MYTIYIYLSPSAVMRDSGRRERLVNECRWETGRGVLLVRV